MFNTIVLYILYSAIAQILNGVVVKRPKHFCGLKTIKIKTEVRRGLATPFSPFWLKLCSLCTFHQVWGGEG